MDVYEKIMPRVRGINRRVLEVLSETEMVQLDAFILRLHQSASLLRDELEGTLPKAQRRLGVHEKLASVSKKHS